MNYLVERYVQSSQYEREWLAGGDPSLGDARFVVETLAESRTIGWVGLHGGAPENRTASLGIAIGDHDFLDGGDVTDAMRVLCAFGFQMMNLNLIDLTVFDWNSRAIRVYEQVGFRHEGVLRDGMWKAGRWQQLVYMGLLRGELQ